MRYIDKLIHDIAYDMAVAELKRTKFLLGLLIGMILGLIFGAVIFIEWLCYIPCK